MMQLRKVCCHPYLLDWPTRPGTDELRTDRAITQASGKMRMLDQILDALFARGHRVLVFSQVGCVANPVYDHAGHSRALGQRYVAWLT